MPAVNAFMPAVNPFMPAVNAFMQAATSLRPLRAGVVWDRQYALYRMFHAAIISWDRSRVIACVCGYLIEDVCFSPLPCSVALFLTIPSLSTSRLRTSLYASLKEEDCFGDRGSPAMQAHNMHSQGSVYIVHICIHTVEPLCNPEHPCTKDTTSLNRTHFPPKCIHFQLLNTPLKCCPIGGDVPLYLYNNPFPINGHTISLCLSQTHTRTHTQPPQ